MSNKVGGHAGQREWSHVAKKIRMGVTAHTLAGTPPVAGQQTAGWDGLNGRKAQPSTTGALVYMDTLHVRWTCARRARAVPGNRSYSGVSRPPGGALHVKHCYHRAYPALIPTRVGLPSLLPVHRNGPQGRAVRGSGAREREGVGLTVSPGPRCRASLSTKHTAAASQLLCQ